MELNVDQHKGMSVLIYAAKLPSYLYQLIENLELSKILGKMVKRTGYKNILTTGLTTLKSMFEFVDKNDGRQIFIQDGTGVEESVYSGSAYGAISAIANDERTGGSTVDQAYPVLHEKVLRSGAGLNAATDLPFWYGYQSAVSRYPNSGTAIALAAGKYLEEQVVNDGITDLGLFAGGDGFYDSDLASQGADVGWYLLYYVPIYDGFQRGFPVTITKAGVLGKYYQLTAQGAINDRILIPVANQSSMKRITDIDIFVANIGTSRKDDTDLYPAYFLERVPLDGDGKVFFQTTGDTANAASTVTITGAASTWKTFNTFKCFLYNATQDEYYQVSADGGAASNVMTVTPAPTADQVGDTIRFFSRWWLEASNYQYKIIYDDYYKKLGSEMYEYLNIPAADLGLSDYRYKYGCMSNKRYFIFGRPDGPFGYFSTVNSPDVIPALNILRLKKEPTGCVAVGRDVMAFYKDSAKRFTVLGNANAEEDDDFSDIGLVGQKALYQLSDEEAYGFDQRGPWHLKLRNHQFIGEHLKEWWEDNLSETEKSACVVGYNRLKNWVMYSFPTYTTSPYTTGVVFVFDRDAQKRDGINAWWIFNTDVALYNFTQADDLHLLAGSTTKIVDINTTGTPSETVATKALLKLMHNPILGNRFHIGKAFFDYTSDTDTVLVKVSADGGSQESLTVSGDKQAVIKYMCQNLELEISTAASANDVEYGSHLIIFHSKRV